MHVVGLPIGVLISLVIPLPLGVIVRPPIASLITLSVAIIIGLALLRGRIPAAGTLYREARLYAQRETFREDVPHCFRIEGTLKFGFTLAEPGLIAGLLPVRDFYDRRVGLSLLVPGLVGRGVLQP